MGIETLVYTPLVLVVFKMLRQALLEVQSDNQFLQAAKPYNVRMNVASCRAFNQHEMALLLELQGSPSGLSKTILSIRRLEGVSFAEESDHDRNHSSLLVVMDMPRICRASRDQTVLCLECPFNSDGGNMSWRFMFGKPSDLNQVTENLSHAGISAKIRDVSLVCVKPTLTVRQLQILRIAAEKGYFEFPRRMGLTELAAVLGVKPSTLSEVLRAAERRIVSTVV
jgi:predicted DNA binding protein